MPNLTRSLLAAAFACGILAGSLPAQDNPVIGVLRVSSLNDLSASVSGFAEAVQPGSSQATAMLPAMVGMYGVDLAGEIAAVLLNPQVSPLAPFALVIPVADPDAALKKPELGFTPTAEDPQTYTFSIPGAPNKMFGVFEGKKLIASPVAGNIKLIRQFVADDSMTAPLRAGGGQIALGLSVDKLYTAYKPMIDGMMSSMSSTMSSGAAASQAAMVQAQANNLLSGVAQVQGLAIRLSVKPEFANLSVGLIAMPNTDLAALFVGGEAPAVRNAGFVQAGCAAVGSAALKMTPETVAAWKNWMTGYFNMLSNSGLSQEPNFKELMAKARDFSAASLDMWDGTAAFGILPEDGSVFMQGTYGVADPARARDFITKLPEMMGSMAAIAKTSGLEMTAELKSTSQHEGADIFEYAITSKMAQGAPGAAQMLAQQRALGIAGENIPTVYALKGNDLAYAQGANALARAREISGKFGSNDAPAITPASYGFAPNPAGFFACSIPRIMKVMAKTGAVKLANPSAPVPEKPGIAGAVTLNNALEFQLSVTSEEIRAAMALQPTGALPGSLPGSPDAGGGMMPPPIEPAAPKEGAPE